MKGCMISLALLSFSALAGAGPVSDSVAEIKLTLGPVQSISLDGSPPVLPDPFGKAHETGGLRKVSPARQRSSYPLFDALGPGYRALKGEAKEITP